MKRKLIKTNQTSDTSFRDKRLTLKQQRFVDAYIQNGGDGAKAVIEAGYNITKNSSIHAISYENLQKPLIRLELERLGYKDCGLISSDVVVEARKIDEQSNRVSSRAERAAFLTSIYEDDSLIIGARLKAVDMLNRMYGDYKSKAILRDNPIEMPRINFIFSDDEDNQK